MIEHIKPLPISEEMLGAYLESNLSLEEARNVEQILQGNDELSAFVNELSMSDDLMSNNLMEDIPSFGNDFNLPEAPTEIETYIEPHISPLGLESSFADIAVCNMMPDLTDDSDMIINDNLTNTEVDIDNISDIGMDINSEVLPIDGE